MWHHTFFDALRVNPEDQACVVSEVGMFILSSDCALVGQIQAPMNPKKNRERMIEMLFEKLPPQKIGMYVQAV